MLTLCMSILIPLRCPMLAFITVCAITLYHLKGACCESLDIAYMCVAKKVMKTPTPKKTLQLLWHQANSQ